MDDILEIVVEVICGVIEALFEEKATKYNNFKVMEFTDIHAHETYIVGLIVTAITLFYDNDNRLDKHERKVFKRLMKTYKKEISIKNRRQIQKLLKTKLSLDNLMSLYDKLGINRYSVIKIASDLERIIYEVDNNEIDITFLKELKKSANPEYY
jgi:mRNA-degrading endonuclease RelE of RelBE toxin-antitoxin system